MNMGNHSVIIQVFYCSTNFVSLFRDALQAQLFSELRFNLVRRKGRIDGV